VLSPPKNDEPDDDPELSKRGAQAAMAEVAFPLHEEEIVALADYLAHL
jgi:hypothetical protein